MMKKFIVLSLLLLGLSFVFAEKAYTVPSFKRQTGMSCSTCHTFFPELTPFGRSFKLGGYVLSTSDKPYQHPPPISVMAQLSHTDAQGLNTGVALFNNGDNDKTNLPQQAGLFYEGTVYDKFNGARLNYDGFGRDDSDNNTLYFLVWLVY
jgi:hypothetical protein